MHTHDNWNSISQTTPPPGATEREEQIKSLVAQIMTLPEEVQKAVAWLIKNMAIVDDLSQGEPMSEEDVERFTKKALAKEDYTMLMMVKYKQVIDEQEAKAAIENAKMHND